MVGLSWFHETNWKFHHLELGREQKSETSVCAQCDQVLGLGQDRIRPNFEDTFFSLLEDTFFSLPFLSSGTSSARPVSDVFLPFL